MTETDILNQEQVAEIEARANAATEEPWTWEPVGEFEGEASNAGGFTYQHIRAGYKGVADTYHASGMQCPDGGVIEPRNGNKDDATFIAHAREDVPALCRTVRAAWASLAEWESHRRGFIELFTTAEQRVEDLESENTALREQLAEAHKNVESLSQAIFRSEQATRMRDLCVEKVKAMADESAKGTGSNNAETLNEDLTRTLAFEQVITALESLTLDQVKENQSEFNEKVNRQS